MWRVCTYYCKWTMWVRLGSIMLMVSFQAQFVGQSLHLLSLSISEPTDGLSFVLFRWQTWCYVEALTLKLMSWVWFLLKHINKAMANNTCCISECCAERFSTQMSTFGWTDQKFSVKVQRSKSLWPHNPLFEPLLKKEANNDKIFHGNV